MGSSLQGSAGRSSRALGVAMGIVAGVSFGFGGAISQILGRQGFTVFDIATAQFFCAVVILGVLTLFTRRAHFAPKEVAMLIGLGAVSTISSITYYLAIDLLSVATAVAIQFQYVWMTIVLQLVVEKKKPSKRIIVIVTLVVVGTLFGSGLADEVLSGGLTADPLGIACALVCTLFYALFIFANGRVAPDQPPIARTFVLVIGGFIVTSAIGWNFYTQPDLVVSLLPGGVVMAVVMSILPVLCIVGASLRLPSGIVAVLTSTELPAAVVAGVLLLGETVTPLVIAGVVMILAGVALSEARGSEVESDEGAAMEAPSGA